jgi:hypothetical protein
METARESRPAAALSALLAGLAAGMTGAFWMLFAMGATAAWKRLSFWTPENLFATFFYGEAALHSGFSSRTVSGLALYLLIYSGLGALFALAVRDRLPRMRVTLLAVLFAICWYYTSFRLLWKTAMPLVALLHQERPTIFGHVIYGAILGRYPVFMRRWNAAAAPRDAVAERQDPGAASDVSGDGRTTVP